MILAAAPEFHDQTLSQPTGDRRVLELGFVTALPGFIALLVAGVVRRCRRTFWLILIAFLFRVLRVPVAILQLTRILAAGRGTDPARCPWRSRCGPPPRRGRGAGLAATLPPASA
jgi:hypothetical protein